MAMLQPWSNPSKKYEASDKSLEIFNHGGDASSAADVDASSPADGEPLLFSPTPSVASPPSSAAVAAASIASSPSSSVLRSWRRFLWGGPPPDTEKIQVRSQVPASK